MSKQLIFNETARQKLLSGIEQITSAVKVTLGPAGRCVFLRNTSGELVTTKDGVTVAKGVDLEDPFENMGAELIKEVSSKSNDEVGDGTTSTTVLADAIIHEGMKSVSAGANPISIKRGIDHASKLCVEHIKELAKDVSGDDIKNVATISANNDPEMGQLVANAIDKVGKDGVITVEESKNMLTTVKVTEGMQLNDCGYISAYFATDTNHKEVVFEDPYILLYDKTISSMNDIIRILEKIAQTGKPLVIIAENVEGEALTTLVINNMRGVLKACAVKAPSFGDNRKAILTDIGVLTGGTLVTEDLGLKLDNVTLDMLGRAKSVKISKDTTTIVNGYGSSEDIAKRADEIRTQIEVERKDAQLEIEIERLKERLAKLSSGVAVIEIGAATETELKEKKYRIDDTLAATHAALEEGIVPGGGSTLLLLSDYLETYRPNVTLSDDDEETGYMAVVKALKKLTWQIAENAGQSGDVIVNKVLNELNSDSSNVTGYDAKTNRYVNMLDAGIIDPAKVTRCVVQNACSIAGMLLTAECVIAEKQTKTKHQDVNMMI